MEGLEAGQGVYQMSNDSKSLSKFMRACWPIGLDYNWHLDAIYKHIELVAAGKAPRLLINLPPSYGRPPPLPDDD